jgi:hypothetical protein
MSREALNRKVHSLLGYCWHETDCIGIMSETFPQDAYPELKLRLRFSDGDYMYKCKFCGKLGSRNFSTNDNYSGNISEAFRVIDRARGMGYHFEINTDTNYIRVFSHIGRSSVAMIYPKKYIAEAICLAFVNALETDERN